MCASSAKNKYRNTVYTYLSFWFSGCIFSILPGLVLLEIGLKTCFSWNHFTLWIVASLCDSEIVFRLTDKHSFISNGRQHTCQPHSTTGQVAGGFWLLCLVVRALWGQMEQGELVNVKPGWHDWLTLGECCCSEMSQTEVEELALQLQTASEWNKGNHWVRSWGLTGRRQSGWVSFIALNCRTGTCHVEVWSEVGNIIIHASTWIIICNGITLVTLCVKVAFTVIWRCSCEKLTWQCFVCKSPCSVQVLLFSFLLCFAWLPLERLLQLLRACNVPGHSSVNYQPQEARSRLSKTVDHVLRDNMAIPHFMHFTELRGIDHLVRFWLEAESFRSTSWSRIRAHSLNSVKHSTLAEPILPSQDGSEGQEFIQPGTDGVEGGSCVSLAAQSKLRDDSPTEPGPRPGTPQADTPTSRPPSRTGTPYKTNSITRDISDKLMKSETSHLFSWFTCTLCCCCQYH